MAATTVGQGVEAEEVAGRDAQVLERPSNGRARRGRGVERGGRVEVGQHVEGGGVGLDGRGPARGWRRHGHDRVGEATVVAQEVAASGQAARAFDRTARAAAGAAERSIASSRSGNVTTSVWRAHVPLRRRVEGTEDGDGSLASRWWSVPPWRRHRPRVVHLQQGQRRRHTVGAGTVPTAPTDGPTGVIGTLPPITPRRPRRR